MLDFRLEIINSQSKLERLVDQLNSVPVMAVDIETVDWWSRHQEKIALIQLAFRIDDKVKVAVIDALAELDLKVLVTPLESNAITKVIHNAAFDAVRLYNHYKFKVAPVHDTMLAARRSGDKKYSLQAQSFIHLNLHLDKTARRSDWSRRPLDLKQISYAAHDVYAALRLYENQLKRNLNGNYRLKQITSSLQGQLPLDDLPEPATPSTSNKTSPQEKDLSSIKNISFPDLSAALTALLGIISDLPSRYGPDQLAVSVGSERVGLAGWIVDRVLGRETDFDEESARLAIADLFERKLIRLTETRRLEATSEGMRLWQKVKPE